jgi:hypothetical protein
MRYGIESSVIYFDFAKIFPSQVIPFLNQEWREGEPQPVSMIRQGEADKVSFDLEMK